MKIVEKDCESQVNFEPIAVVLESQEEIDSLYKALYNRVGSEKYMMDTRSLQKLLASYTS